MVEGFPKLVNELIQSRLDSIMTSEEYEMFMEGIYQDLEQRLSSSIKDLDEEAKHNLIEDLRNHVYEHAYRQSKLTYRIAFKDAYSFFVDTLLQEK